MGKGCFLVAAPILQVAFASEVSPKLDAHLFLYACFVTQGPLSRKMCEWRSDPSVRLWVFQRMERGSASVTPWAHLVILQRGSGHW